MEKKSVYANCEWYVHIRSENEKRQKKVASDKAFGGPSSSVYRIIALARCKRWICGRENGNGPTFISIFRHSLGVSHKCIRRLKDSLTNTHQLPFMFSCLCGILFQCSLFTFHRSTAQALDSQFSIHFLSTIPFCSRLSDWASYAVCTLFSLGNFSHFIFLFCVSFLWKKNSFLKGKFSPDREQASTYGSHFLCFHVFFLLLCV